MIEKWPRYATRQNISLSINWMAPLAARLSPPHSFRIFVGYPSAAWTVSHEKLTPGPGREKLLYSVENFQIGWWKVQKFTCCPAEWISASVFPRWTRYSPRIRTRLGGLIRWEEKKKWKKRGRRGIFARVPFPLTSLREKKSPTRLFKYREKGDLFNIGVSLPLSIVSWSNY